MQTDFLIRPATVNDAAAIINFKEKCWRFTYADIFPAAVFTEIYSEPSKTLIIKHWQNMIAAGAKVFLAESTALGSRQLLGIALAEKSRDVDSPVDLELSVLYVSPTHQNRKIGSSLLTAATGNADTMLWVVDGNKLGEQFYLARGFEYDGACRQIFPEHGNYTELRMVRKA